MAGAGTGKAAGLVIGGFLCLGLIMLAIAATIILSLISIYTSNDSQVGFGDEYRLNSVVLKAIFGNVSKSFINGTVADNPALSSLCGMVYRGQGAIRFAGCVAQNFRATKGNTSLSSRRRRQNEPAGLYMLGQLRIFYSTACPRKADKSKFAGNSSLSTCVTQRLNQCNAIVNATNFTEWGPVPNGFTLSVVDTTLSGYVALGVQRLFAVPFAIARALVTPTSLAPDSNSGPAIALGNGCQYIGPLSQAAIAAALAAQSTATTTLPTSTGMGMG